MTPKDKQITCADGFSFAQTETSDTRFVEIADLSEFEPMFDAYIEREHPYAFRDWRIPVDVVSNVIAKHGGNAGAQSRSDGRLIAPPAD